MKNIKRAQFLLPLLLIAITSIGFSSWNISSAKKIETVYKSGDIFRLENFISYDDQVVLFEFCPYGLIVDETIADSGELTFGFTFLNTKTFIDVIGHNNLELIFDFTSSCSNDMNFNIFNFLSESETHKYSISSSKNNISYTNEITDLINNPDSSLINFTIEIPNISIFENDQFYFSFKLNFDFSSVINDFNTSVYQKICNNSLKFKMATKTL